MEVWAALGYVLLGGILGAVGQGMIVIVGIKKQLDKASACGKKWEDWFEMKKLLSSLIIALYANNKVETKSIYGVVNIELKGRSANPRSGLCIPAYRYTPLVALQIKQVN